MLDGQIHGEDGVKPQSPPAESVERFRALGVSTASSALAGPAARQRLLDAHRLHRVAGSGAVAGPAVTAWHPPGTNRMIIPILEAAERGDVVVICGDSETAMWGEVSATIAAGKGVAAVLVDGVLRDAEAVREIGIPTWATRIFAGQGFRREPGLLNVPVQVAGLLIRPGDIILADDDGIFCVPPELLDLAIERGEHKVELERGILEEARTGVIPTALRGLFDVDGDHRGDDRPGTAAS